MRQPALILFILFTIIAKGYSAKYTEPCKEAFVPADIKSSVIIFELTTYDEYISDVALNPVIGGEIIEEKNILDEVIFEKIRKQKLTAIKSVFKGHCTILTKRQVENLSNPDSYVMREYFVSNLISPFKAKFEEYTLFTITDMRSGREYKLLDPTTKKLYNCTVGSDKVKYADMLAALLN